MPHRSQLLFAASFGFVCGVVARFLFAPEALTSIGSSFPYVSALNSHRASVIAFVLFGSTLALLFVYRKSDLLSSCRSVLGVMWIATALAGYIYVDHVITHALLYEREGEVLVQREMIVSTQPVRREFALVVTATEIHGDLRVLIDLPKYEDVTYGSLLMVTCTLERPEAFDGFNYPMFLKMRKVDYLCSAEGLDVQVIGYEPHSLARIAKWRSGVERNIEHLIKAPEAGLANGLLFGGDDRLSDNLQDDFAATGMSHIVAVSGYNVTVIVQVMMVAMIFLGLWRRQAALMAFAAVTLFVMMIGFPSSGVRAAIMGTLMLLAAIYGRLSQSLGAVVFVGAVMLVWNPLQIAYDVGFQLSFGAVFGIIAFYPICEKLLIKRHKSFGLLEILLLSVSAQAFVVPIILYHFSTIATMSLITNLLVLPVLPFTMLFAFVTAVLSLIWAPIGFALATPFALIAQLLLHYEIVVIQFFAHADAATITLENFPTGLVVCYYAALGMIIYWAHRKNYYN